MFEYIVSYNDVRKLVRIIPIKLRGGGLPLTRCANMNYLINTPIYLNKLYANIINIILCNSKLWGVVSKNHANNYVRRELFKTGFDIVIKLSSNCDSPIYYRINNDWRGRLYYILN